MPADEADISSEREQIARDEALHNARLNNVAPVLGCLACSNIDQATAKRQCPHFAGCVTDWERLQKSKRIAGKC